MGLPVGPGVSELGAAVAEEMATGQKRFLPIVATDPERVFDDYPLLRDKIFKRWDEGLENIVEELETILAEDS